MKTERDRCIALAGVFQAAELARQVATKGMGDTAAMEASLGSLLKIDADSVSDVYGGVDKVLPGLRTVQRLLTSRKQADGEVTRYVIALLHLERKLSRSPKMLQIIQDGICLAQERVEHFHLMHPNIVSQLADIYSNTISTLKPRIMVHGEPLHLQNPDNVNRIRALLLAGIRSAMLWRQCGGRRLQVLFGRKRLLSEINSLLELQ
jgi:high frequency lysogenization protein